MMLAELARGSVFGLSPLVFVLVALAILCLVVWLVRR
jgi:hypothetical protein